MKIFVIFFVLTFSIFSFRYSDGKLFFYGKNDLDIY